MPVDMIYSFFGKCQSRCGLVSKHSMFIVQLSSALVAVQVCEILANVTCWQHHPAISWQDSKKLPTEHEATKGDKNVYEDSFTLLVVLRW